jgi:tyrosyl-tRNA synthetase
MSEFDYWQFWRNTADADVIKMLKLFTEVPLERITEFDSMSGAALNDAKVLLADEATKLLHGENSLEKIKDSVKSLFGGVKSDDILDHLDSLVHVECSDESIVTADDRGKGVDLGAALVAVGLSTSRSEARRSIAGGAVRVGSGDSCVKVDDAYFVLRREHFDDKGRVKLSMGKKKHVVFVVPLNLL